MTSHLGMIGLGAIGQSLLAALQDEVDHITVLVRPGHLRPDEGRLQFVSSPEALIARRPDLIVECAGHAAVRDAVVPALRGGIDCLIASVGALANPVLEAEVRAAARDGGAQAILPAGAIGGIDLLAAMAQSGGIDVTYRGTKPLAAWQDTLAAETIDLANLKAPVTFFSGSARQAAQQFPRNANVAATLALAGAGLDSTKVDLVADPAAVGNLHEYWVSSSLGQFEMRIHNAASSGNAKTSAATIQSLLRAIRNRSANVVI